MAALSAPSTTDKPRYAQYASGVHQERQLLDGKASSEHHITWMEQALTQLTLNSRDPSTDLSVKSVATEINQEKKKLSGIVSDICVRIIIKVKTCLTKIKERELSRIRAQRKGLLKKKEGPFVEGLDKALASFNVYRQAYYGGTFIGNHIHRTLKV